MSVRQLKPLHQRFSNADGPVDAYRASEPWTPELQRAWEASLQESEEEINPSGLHLRVVRTAQRCPKCDRGQEEILIDSVTFYADEDLHRLHPKGEAKLITMVACGHRFGLEIGP